MIPAAIAQTPSTGGVRVAQVHSPDAVGPEARRRIDAKPGPDEGRLMFRRAGLMVFTALAMGAAVAILRRTRGHLTGREVRGGILLPDAGAYDKHSRMLLTSLFRGIASDIAAVAPPAARVLEIGCGPGHLLIR